jgi:YidC/Oxa1 family membrane protein insertase
MSQLFHLFFYQPIFNLLFVLYFVIPGKDLGISIIVLTTIIKLLLWPLSQKSIKSQKELQDLQPKINAIKENLKDNKEEMGRAMMSLYKEHKINLLSSCLPLLIQLPFFLAIFRVFRDLANPKSILALYSFVPHPDIITNSFLGFLDLSKPNVVLAVLAGAAQFWQAKMMSTKRAEVKVPPSRDEDFTAILNKQMLYMMPILTIVIGLRFPSGLALYWLTTTVLTVLQQVYVFKKTKIG